MANQIRKNNFIPGQYIVAASGEKGTNYAVQSYSGVQVENSGEKFNAIQDIFKVRLQPGLDILLTQLTALVSKKSFLVFRNNKYINILTENIAFFCVKYGSTVIVCFDKQEYFVNYSLDQLQGLLAETEFFRLNRQYLIHFYAVKEVEHYFARKLLVNLTIPAREKLLVSKEKVSGFLHWLDNR